MQDRACHSIDTRILRATESWQRTQQSHNFAVGNAIALRPLLAIATRSEKRVLGHPLAARRLDPAGEEPCDRMRNRAVFSPQKSRFIFGIRSRLLWQAIVDLRFAPACGMPNRFQYAMRCDGAVHSRM